MSGRTLVRLFCLLAGAILLVEGIYGFAALDRSFATPGAGWHHLVHVVSGVVLLASARNAATASAAAIAFGILYGGIALAGLADGDDIAGLLPAGPVDIVLHGLLALASLGAGLAARPRRAAVPAA